MMGLVTSSNEEIVDKSRYLDGGCSSVVRESDFRSEDPGFDPLAGQGEGPFSCPSESTLVQTCLCLIALPVCGTHPNVYALYSKDPIRKRVGLTASGMET